MAEIIKDKSDIEYIARGRIESEYQRKILKDAYLLVAFFALSVVATYWVRIFGLVLFIVDIWYAIKLFVRIFQREKGAKELTKVLLNEWQKQQGKV